MGSRLVPVNELVTVDEIAKRLKISVNSVCNIVRGRERHRRLKFPKPLVGHGTRAVWLWEDVAEWNEHAALKNVKPQKRAASTYRQPSWSHGRKGAA